MWSQTFGLYLLFHLLTARPSNPNPTVIKIQRTTAREVRRQQVKKVCHIILRKWVREKEQQWPVRVINGNTWGNIAITPQNGWSKFFSTALRVLWILVLFNSENPWVSLRLSSIKLLSYLLPSCYVSGVPTEPVLVLCLAAVVQRFPFSTVFCLF